MNSVKWQIILLLPPNYIGEGLTLVYIIRYVDILLVVFRHSSYRCHLASAWPYYGGMDVWCKGFFCSWQRQKVLKIGVVEIRRIYFLDAFCHYEEMRKNNRFSHILVYLGGSLCNLLSVLILNTMIANDILPEHQFFYQFAYFSVYYVFLHCCQSSMQIIIRVMGKRL